MANLGSRVSVMKKRAIKYGRKITRLHIGRTREVFTIHEDLLCANSPFFHKKLQEKRQPIEGDCAICHEQLDPGIKELTYCSAECGVNLHYDCLQNWDNQRSAGQDTLTCPFCRTKWAIHRDEQVLRYQNFNEEAFGIYSEWLYQGTISYQRGEDEDALFDYSDLINGYLLGDHLQDSKFSNAILEALLEVFDDQNQLPGPEELSLVYEKTSAHCALRRLLVEVYTIGPPTDYYESEDWNEYPAEFMRDIAALLLKRWRQTWNLAELKRKFCYEKNQEPEDMDITDSGDDNSDVEDNGDAVDNSSLGRGVGPVPIVYGG